MSFDFSLPDICIHGSTVFARKQAELGLKGQFFASFSEKFGGIFEFFSEKFRKFVKYDLVVS